MLHGKVLRSPYAHARIKSINYDAALELPGVFAIVTGADSPESRQVVDLGEGAVNSKYVSMNVLAHGKALYDGHAIAAVAAINTHVADQALQLIKVEYEVLPPAMKVDDAMQPGAPIILSELRNKEEGPTKNNVANHLKFTRGTLAEGFAAADLSSSTNSTPRWSIKVTRAAQCGRHLQRRRPRDGLLFDPGNFRGALADRQVLQMPEGNIRVVPAEIGGGFGGKLTIYLEPLAVLLSKKTAAR